MSHVLLTVKTEAKHFISVPLGPAFHTQSVFQGIHHHCVDPESHLLRSEEEHSTVYLNPGLIQLSPVSLLSLSSTSTNFSPLSEGSWISFMLSFLSLSKGFVFAKC